VIAEPVAIADTGDGNFNETGTRTVIIGACGCPGRPHDIDTAEILRVVPWDVLLDVGARSGGAAYRALVLGILRSWNLVDAAGDPVPVAAAVNLRPERLEPIAEAVNEAYERTSAPLPNASGAPSPRLRQVSASPNPTIRPRKRHTK
jgi:hypothetical protein